MILLDLKQKQKQKPFNIVAHIEQRLGIRATA